MAIFNHFKTYETDINNNSLIKQVFIEALKKLLFSTVGNKKAQVLNKIYVDRLLNQCISKYQQFRTPSVSV